MDFGGGRNAAHTEPRSHAVVCRRLCRAEPRIPEGPLPKAREQQAPVPLWPWHCLAVDSYCIPGSANIYPSCGRPVTPSTATLLTCPQLDLGNRNSGGGWDSHRALAGTLGTDGYLLSLASMPASFYANSPGSQCRGPRHSGPVPTDTWKEKSVLLGVPAVWVI